MTGQQAKHRDRLQVLRRIAGYASYRVFHDNDETAKAELASLKWGLAVIEETRDSLTEQEWGDLLARAAERRPVSRGRTAGRRIGS